MGFTLNTISLLALSLVAGILVDDAIVEIENIVRHMRMGKTAYQASMDAADEIGLAVVATTMAIIASIVAEFVGSTEGLGFLILFFANAYLLSREYFELAAMRFRTPEEAKAMRKANAGYVFLTGMIIAGFVSVPILNFATPVFAMAFMVHIHKKMSGSRTAVLAA